MMVLLAMQFGIIHRVGSGPPSYFFFGVLGRGLHTANQLSGVHRMTEAYGMVWSFADVAGALASF